ncbi:MAG: anaerobic ribonucleoside-triphosphate reductase, partial [Fusobacteriaceae bacterium]
TFSFGDVLNTYESDVSKAILEVRMEGHGKVGFKKILIFPKLVFLHNESIHGKDKEFEELFNLSVKCSSKAMYPDYIGEGHKREGLWITPMGCRAYLSDYRDPITGKLVFEGRFNLGAISLNLPMIYMKSKEENKDFYETLDYYLEIIRGMHKKRYEYVGKAKASSNPLMFTQGGAYGGTLQPNDKIEPLLKSATISFGVTALHELSLLATNKSLRESNEFALEVMNHINKMVDKYKDEDGHLYAIYNSPAENLCGVQVKQFREIYGIVDKVSDKDYFTNSNHLWVGEEITPFEKQDKEETLFHLSKGGHIQYVKITNTDNLEAMKALVLRGLGKGFYQGVNFDACTCDDCGLQQNDMGEICPKCGSINITEFNRTCGYLGFSRKGGDRTFNDAKMAEIKDRVSM